MDNAQLTIDWLRPAHTPMLMKLLGDGSNGCFCHFWHFEGDDYAWQLRCGSNAQANRLASATAIRAGSLHGIIALAEDVAVGWLSLLPAPQMHKLTQRRVYRTLPSLHDAGEDVWRVGCALVAPTWRGQQLCRRMLRRAINLARVKKIIAIEAFPRHSETALRAEEMWMGPAGDYRALGFEQVDGPDGYPVMRLTIQ